MSLQSTPPELLDKICYFLALYIRLDGSRPQHTYDLASFCRTSKAFYTIGLPRLYRFVHLPLERPIAFPKTVITNPWLASMVQEIQIRTISESRIANTERDSLRLYALQAGIFEAWEVDNVLNDESNYSRLGDFVVIILLLHLINLRRLNLDFRWNSASAYTLSKLGTPNICLLPALETLDLNGDLDIAHPLLFSTRITSLTVEFLGTHSTTFSNLNYDYPNVSKLDLRHCGASEHDLNIILKRFSRLSIFVYQFSRVMLSNQWGGRLEATAQEIVHALRRNNLSLEVLQLDVVESCLKFSTSITPESLRAFPRLNKLVVNGHHIGRTDIGNDWNTASLVGLNG